MPDAIRRAVLRKIRCARRDAGRLLFAMAHSIR